jgi:hypothetical protein
VGKPESYRPFRRPRSKFKGVDMGLKSDRNEAWTRFSWLTRGAFGGLF